MGIATNGARCNKCEEEFYLVLEWSSKEDAMKTIQNTKCPKCGSDDWSFTDEMGQ